MAGRAWQSNTSAYRGRCFAVANVQIGTHLQREEECVRETAYVVGTV